MPISYLDRNPQLNNTNELDFISREVQKQNIQSLSHAFKTIDQNPLPPTLFAEAASSRFADREPRIGASFGRGKVEKVFAKGGAYIFLITSDYDIPLLVCRGMCPNRKGATGQYLSGINGVTIDFGFYGAQQNLEDINTYLESRNITQINLIGKSLGGAHAQYLSLLLKAKTQMLVTYCSPGIGNYKTSADVIVLRNDGDKVPYVGGAHISGASTRIFSIKHANSAWTEENVSFLKKMIEFFKSFANPHVRQTSMEPFSIKEIPLSHLNDGNTFEPIRKIVSYCFNIFTCGYFNRVRFSL